MPTGSRSQGGLAAAVLVMAALVVALVCVGLSFAFGFLRTLWQEQFRVDDPELNVVVTTGKMVHPDVVTFHFGLTNGANLATIPFAELRETLLEKVPNIRDIKMERRLPNRVVIDVVERVPIARIAGRRSRAARARVADAQGIVFRFSANTDDLPLVRETAEPVTPPGKKLPPAAAAAVRLVETLAEPEFTGLRVLEIDTSPRDYLLLTLADYSRAKIAWDHMLEDTNTARTSLRKQLTRLSKAIKTRISPQTTLWMATDFGTPGRVYANDSASPGVR